MKSSGRVGEQLAEYKFSALGWVMHRHQPETRMVMLRGKLTQIYAKSTGMPDYTGYELVQVYNARYPLYRACEVKEATGRSMPCSRLGKPDDPGSQNNWMSRIDHRCAFVCVVWMDGEIKAEMFKWKQTGSYKQGEGF